MICILAGNAAASAAPLTGGSAKGCAVVAASCRTCALRLDQRERNGSSVPLLIAAVMPLGQAVPLLWRKEGSVALLARLVREIPSAGRMDLARI